MPLSCDCPSQELLEDVEKMQEPGGGGVDSESILAVNLLVQFFFRQWRSQGSFRRFLLKKLNQEMEEIISKGAVSKIIKSMKVSRC